ncbi:MAG: hypothetical protein V1645_01275 [archaeon]
MDAKNNNRFVDDQICDSLKELSPEKLAEIKREAKELGYNSVTDYLLNARVLYSALYEETKKGKVVHLLIREHGVLEKILQNLGSSDRIIKLNINGLQYKQNGNKTTEYTGK